MSKLLFEVEQDGDWLVALCHEPEMATQAHSLEELPAMIQDLVNCRFDSPARHEAILCEREEDSQSGKEKPMDWEMAKASLRKLRPSGIFTNYIESRKINVQARQGERK